MTIENAIGGLVIVSMTAALSWGAVAALAWAAGWQRTRTSTLSKLNPKILK
jgi:hypothetical protein